MSIVKSLVNYFNNVHVRMKLILLGYEIGAWDEGIESWYEDDTHVISQREF